MPLTSLLLIESVAAAARALALMPVSAPELANAYLTQPSAEVPSALLLIATDVVFAPVLVMPVTACAVDEVAKPRSVLVFILNVAPVPEFRIKTEVPPPVVEVSVPALDRLVPPVRV
jgi:hypothetical protein